MQCLGRWPISASAKPPAPWASASTRCAAGTATASSRPTRDERNRRRVPASEVERLRSHPERHRTGDALSTRNRFPGRVTSVEVDGVMALVEIEAGPHRVTAAITRDSVEELGLAEGVEATAMVKATSVMVERGACRHEARSPSAPWRSLRCSPPAAADDSGSLRRATGELVVSAASSLEPAFTAYAEAAGIDAKQSFAGSDDLAAQIRQGVTPDVYAAANTTPARRALRRGPGRAAGRLRHQQAGPRGARRTRRSTRSTTSTAGDVTLAIGDEGVPVGDYTREVLGAACRGASRGDPRQRRARWSPTSPGSSASSPRAPSTPASSTVTDVAATDGALKAIELPAELQPDVAYGAAVVDGAANPEGAQAFIDGLLERRRRRTRCSRPASARRRLAA